MTKTSNTTNTASEANRYQQLREDLNYLRLPDAAEALPTVLDQAKTENLSATAMLERLLSIEVQATEARRLTRRLRFANLPSPATLEDFDYDAQPGVEPALIRDLASNRYLETGTNILLIGPPGVGKTMLAIGLARKVAEADHRTYFTNAADLGYLPLPAEAASALFQVVNQRYLKSCIIMTTNQPVTEWGQILGDNTVAAALLDRLLHRSVVIDNAGDSYRLRDHQARTDNLRHATTPEPLATDRAAESEPVNADRPDRGDGEREGPRAERERQPTVGGQQCQLRGDHEQAVTGQTVNDGIDASAAKRQPCQGRQRGRGDLHGERRDERSRQRRA